VYWGVRDFCKRSLNELWGFKSPARQAARFVTGI
jgi:hypothetical protein